MLREFKEFLTKGNVLGLAVAVVMGVAFGLVIGSFTNDILMQLIAAVGAKPDFGQLSFTLNGAEIRYGAFLTQLLNFLVVAFAMFLTVKAYNRFSRRELQAPQEEKELLRQIRDGIDALRREQLPH